MNLCTGDYSSIQDGSEQLADVRRAVALICTTYNCKDGLESSLKTFTRPDNLVLLSEIVIVDGGSKDGTWELLKQWAEKVDKLKAFQVCGANIPRGRNEAIKRTNVDIIVTFDSGTLYSNDWLKLMLEPFHDCSVKVTGAATHPYGVTMYEKHLAVIYDRSKSDGFNPSHRGCAFYKEVWERIGGYPENVGAGEDTWFNTQWRKMGLKYVHVPEAKNEWRVRHSWKSTLTMEIRNKRGHFALGEPTGARVCAFIMSLYIFCVLCLVFGFYEHWLWLLGSVMYIIYLSRRLLDKRRRRYFKRPVGFLVGAYALSALDLGVTVGMLEGLVLFLKHKGYRNKKK